MKIAPETSPAGTHILNTTKEDVVARLEIRLLGSFDAFRDGDRVADFESDSTRALLACLASEPGRAWSRAVLAEMLWPERPEGAALGNLRHVLSVLRWAIGDRDAERPNLLAEHGTVAIRGSPDVWVDLVEFERLAATPVDQAEAVEAWERAVDLWRGPLLEGLQVWAGAEWEEWLLVTAERARRQLAATLRRVADHYERAGEWERALPFARRLTAVDPWEERGHRQLMRLLARTGENAQALTHFVDWHDRLGDELGTAPAAETTALMEQIRDGDLSMPAPELEIVYPEFLAATTTRVGSPSFVGMERELGLLHGHLDAVLAGDGRIVLVAGEAGSGKSMLAAELMRRATEHTADLLAARGRCNVYSGLGDPYLPFREVLGLLSGDVKPGCLAGAIDREQATRLWEAIPFTTRLVCERGSSLVGIMIHGESLLHRAVQAVPGAEWLDGLRTRVEAVAQLPPAPERMQPALFDEYTKVLEGLAAAHPLMLVVDDLQWADRGSIALLWHLARRLEGLRLLVVGIYRPEEITGTGGEEHPLEPVLRELQAATADCTIELGADRGFVDAFLDSEPNNLDAQFRNRLFSYTNGHPLFTVEMVRGMQERAEIRRNRAGVWTARELLDWNRLPSRVEAVIAQRIARLPADLRRDLAVASVQGEEFVAETVAVVRQDPDLPARLSRESMSAHRLIEPSGVTRIDGRLAARHRFRHVLFQRYLYDQLDRAERIRLHEATGRALEDLYRGQPDPPVVDLAHHFDEAGLAEPAIGYLQLAGQRAVRMSANEEAIRLLQRALTLLRALPESPERDSLELGLLVSLVAALMAVRGYATPEAEQIGRGSGSCATGWTPHRWPRWR